MTDTAGWKWCGNAPHRKEIATIKPIMLIFVPHFSLSGSDSMFFVAHYCNVGKPVDSERSTRSSNQSSYQFLSDPFSLQNLKCIFSFKWRP